VPLPSGATRWRLPRSGRRWLAIRLAHQVEELISIITPVRTDDFRDLQRLFRNV
jgi:hypothetical protein